MTYRTSSHDDQLPDEAGPRAALAQPWRRRAWHIALASSLGCLLTSAAAAQLTHVLLVRLAATPVQWWTMRDAALSILCASLSACALVCAWYAASAWIVLRWAHCGARTRELLRQWGAPAVRTLAASVLCSSLILPSAGAAPANSSDDLGWEPTMSVSASPTPVPVSSATSSMQATPPSPASPASLAVTPSVSPSASGAGTAAPLSPTGSPSPGIRSQSIRSTGIRSPELSVPSPAPAPAPAPASLSPTGWADVAAQDDSQMWAAREQVIEVQHGDSLWSLCRHLLGAQASAHDIARAWPELYRANRQAIGENPNHLSVGLQLTVPAALTVPFQS